MTIVRPRIANPQNSTIARVPKIIRNMKPLARARTAAMRMGELHPSMLFNLNFIYRTSNKLFNFSRTDTVSSYFALNRWLATLIIETPLSLTNWRCNLWSATVATIDKLSSTENTHAAGPAPCFSNIMQLITANCSYLFTLSFATSFIHYFVTVITQNLPYEIVIRSIDLIGFSKPIDIGPATWHSTRT